MGKTEQPLIVRYKNQWYDLTEFAHKHPGGKNSLTGLHEKDMAERFDRAPGHSQAAKYLMKEYQIKHEPKQKQQNGHSLPNGTKATVNGTTLRNGTKPTGNGLHSAKPHGEGHTTAVTANGDVAHLTDDSMEVRHPGEGVVVVKQMYNNYYTPPFHRFLIANSTYKRTANTLAHTHRIVLPVISIVIIIVISYRITNTVMVIK